MNPKNTNLTTAKIEQGKPLPPMCILCGNKSETVLFKKKTQSRKDYWYLYLFSWNFFLYLFFGSIYRTKVGLELPICRACKKEHHLIQAQKVDYVNGFMEFEVHPKFKEELEKFRKSRYIRYNQIF